MEELVVAALSQDEQAKKDRLIKALLLMNLIYDRNVSLDENYDFDVCPELHRVAKVAVAAKLSNFAIIAELHNEDSLEKSIKELNAAGKLKEIKPEVIDAVLNASANAKKQAAAPSAVVAYPTHNASSIPFRFFDPKKDKVALGVTIGAAVLGVGGLVTAFTFIGLATTTISTSTAAMAAVATAAAAGTAFPPLGIAILATVGAALVITGIVLAAMAIQHSRNMKQMQFGSAAFNSFATGRPRY